MPVLFINKHVPAVYNKDTHYVINTKLTLETLRKFLIVNKYYKSAMNTQAALQPWVHYMSLIREIPLNTVSMDKDVFLDNKNIAVEQEVKNIKLQN